VPRKNNEKPAPCPRAFFGRTTWPLYLMGLFFLTPNFVDVHGNAKNIRAIYFAAPNDWRATWGIVTSSIVDSMPVSKSTSRLYWPEVSYTYTVDGVKYTGNRISFNERTFDRYDCHIAVSISRGYVVGKRVMVYYLPSEPDLCALDPLNKNNSYLVFPISLAIVGIGFVVVAVKEDLRLLRQSKAPEKESHTFRTAQEGQSATVT
jgi:hypothetical protein